MEIEANMVVSLRDRRRKTLEDEILKAARHLLAEKGHTGMSMDELAAQVGISKPTLYSFFSTKEDLVVSAMSCAMEELIDFIEAHPPEQPPLQRLIAIFRTAVQHRLDDLGSLPRTWPPDLSLLLQEHPRAMGYLRRLDAQVVSLVHAAIAANEIDPMLEPATIIWTLYALLGVPYLAQFSAGGIPDPARAAITLARILEHGICNQEMTRAET